MKIKQALKSIKRIRAIPIVYKFQCSLCLGSKKNKYPKYVKINPEAS